MRRKRWKYAPGGTAPGFTCLALLVATVSPLYGQEKSAAEADKASGSVQHVQRDYRFEVASIRPGPSSLPAPPGPSYTPGRFRTEGTTIPGLAFQAFRKKHGFELECPQWMVTTHFTINATLPEGATQADLPIMIQHLLEDRFALKYHHEAKQMAGYELVVARSGPRLTKSATPNFDGATLHGSGIEIRDGLPQFGKDAGRWVRQRGLLAAWPQSDDAGSGG